MLMRQPGGCHSGLITSVNLLLVFRRKAENMVGRLGACMQVAGDGKKAGWGS